MNDNYKQDPYHIDLMRTLWENTFRATVFDSRDQYTATLRIILSFPMDRENLPENAPDVGPVIITLIEDTVLSPIEVVDFEQVLSNLIAKRFTNEQFRPERVMFFYPSPAEGAETKDKK